MPPTGAVYCLQCGASLVDQERHSVAMERVRLVLSDSYPLVRRLGEGGMATVYLARDVKHGRQVAVKILRPEVAACMGTERFLREITVAASLQHPHILPLHDSGEARETGDGPPILYYVMPFVKGESLRGRLEREVQLPLDEALRIAQEVAGALDYAHRQGVVHRDIKPENILLSEGQPLIADFGIARALGDTPETRITEAGLAVGSPMYMSPEQAAGGTGPLDGRTDIYSLGCVLYEMLAGEPPYTGPTAQSVIAKRFTEPIPQLRTVRKVPEGVDAAVHRALEKVPADRFATAAEFAEALAAARKRAESPAAPPPVEVRKPRPMGRNRWRLAWVGLGAALLVAALLLWRASRRPALAASASRLAVLPFGHPEGDEARDLSSALVALLSSVLDGVGDLRTVDPNAVLASLADGSAPDPARARDVAARLGAARYVLGNVIEGAGGQYTVIATAYGEHGQIVGRATVEARSRDQVFRVVNELAVKLLGAFEVSQSPRRLESISTGSIVALNEYLKGEAALRRSEYQEAADAFTRATTSDSLFALAWFRQAYALTWTENPARAMEPSRRALALRASLSSRDLRLAEALSAQLNVNPERADQLYRQIVYDYPDDVEGWMGHADVMLHFGPLYGLAMDSISWAFERVLFLDPQHSEARAHLPWAAALEGRLDLLDSATTLALAKDSTDYYAPVWRILRAFARGDTTALNAAIVSQGAMDDLQRLLAVNMSAMLRRPADTGRLALALLAAPSRQPEVRAFGRLLAAHCEMALGHLAAADRLVALAESLDSTSALEDRVLLALTPFRETPDSTLRRLREHLEVWSTRPRPGIGNAWVAPHDSLHAPIRLYLLGALSGRMGDAAAAQRYAAELTRYDTATAPGSVAQALAHVVRADFALLQGRRAEGIGLLDEGGLRGRYARTWQRAYSSPILSQSLERRLRAQALAELGRGPEALRWYRSLWMANGFDLLWLVPSELGQAEVLEAQKNRAGALAHYQAAAALWQEADPALRPQMDAINRRIAALQR